MELQPHQQRVVDEKKELDERITKLSAFIDNQNGPASKLPSIEFNLLWRQRIVMQEYSTVLAERMSLWGVTVE